MAVKACKVCNYLTDEKKCPACGSDDLSLRWKGVIIIADSEKSAIAKEINIGKNGRYAITVE
jgi:RNA polymerase subunit RPABC4/transcription elongation factor Spt4